MITNTYPLSSMDSRVAILGANGTGKSTLLHMITGVLQPTVGTVSKHNALKLAKYSQHSADQLPYDLSPIDYFQQLFHEKYPEKDIQAWRAQLGRFGLSGAHQTSPIRQLSDGLRNRVVFSQLAVEHPHILLLGMSCNIITWISAKRTVQMSPLIIWIWNLLTHSLKPSKSSRAVLSLYLTTSVCRV